MMLLVMNFDKISGTGRANAPPLTLSTIGEMTMSKTKNSIKQSSKFSEIRCNRVTHGATIGGKSPAYVSWLTMRYRCFNTVQKRYYRYGGRGITVCNRWRNSFENFLADMGERPEGLTLDRINNDGDYTPENCRWATYEEQANNTPRNRYITLNGMTLSVSQWSRKINLHPQTIYSRLNRGCSPEDALMIVKKNFDE